MHSSSLVLRPAAVFLAVTALCLSLTATVNPSPKQDRHTPARDDHTGASVYTMGIEGMMCEASCAPEVKAALSGIDGVTAVDLDFAAGTALVSVRSGHTLTPSACDDSFDNQGYFVTNFQRLH